VKEEDINLYLFTQQQELCLVSLRNPLKSLSQCIIHLFRYSYTSSGHTNILHLFRYNSLLTPLQVQQYSFTSLGTLVINVNIFRYNNILFLSNIIYNFILWPTLSFSFISHTHLTLNYIVLTN